MTSKMIDLNLDAGESAEALKDGSEEALYQLVTSVNIACGGHAGDSDTMSRAVELALKHSLNIGAHPSYPDRQNFGRTPMVISRASLIDSLSEQIESLKKICSSFGARIQHVKPHGALYNVAAENFETADAVLKSSGNLPVMALSGSSFIKWIYEAGRPALQEAFADRLYESDGSLRKRSFPDAVINDPGAAADQAVKIVAEKSVISVSGKKIHLHADTICIHGDTPNAYAVAQAVKTALVNLTHRR